MEYKKKFDPDNLIDNRFLVLEDIKMKVGMNGRCCYPYNPEEINKEIIIEKGDALTVKRVENGCYVLSVGNNRVFIPVGEFPRIQMLQAGDIVQFGKRRIGKVAGIYYSHDFGVNILKGSIESPGEESGESIRIGIDDLLSVISPQK